ncbi:MAG: acyltransferase [Polyangiales bacterium]
MAETYVHETAVIDATATIGAGSRIWHFCHVSDGAMLGERCVLGQNVFVGKDVVIGAGTKIQNNVSIYSGVEVHRNVFLGPSCVFTNVNHPRAHVERKDAYARTIVGEGASVGANATIVCGIELGAYCFIGAGSVVTKDVKPHALVYGTPAKHQGWVCQCGEVLRGGDRVTCGRCGSQYDVNDNECVEVKRG